MNRFGVYALTKCIGIQYIKKWRNFVVRKLAQSMIVARKFRERTVSKRTRQIQRVLEKKLKLVTFIQDKRKKVRANKYVWWNYCSYHAIEISICARNVLKGMKS